MDATQVALVLDAVVARWRSALGPLGIEVIDGQPLQTQLNHQDVVIVGWSPARVGVEIVQEESDLAANRDETLSIVCLASSWRGDSNPVAPRNRVVQILVAAKATLEADPELDGVVASAELGFEMALDQAQTNDGPTATIEFTVLAVTL